MRESTDLRAKRVNSYISVLHLAYVEGSTACFRRAKRQASCRRSSRLELPIQAQITQLSSRLLEGPGRQKPSSGRPSKPQNANCKLRNTTERLQPTCSCDHPPTALRGPASRSYDLRPPCHDDAHADVCAGPALREPGAQLCRMPPDFLPTKRPRCRKVSGLPAARRPVL